MAELNKGALTSENNNSFPNNNTGFITPTLLRTFNGNMIDSMVDEISYNVDSSSFNTRINAFASASTPAGTVSSSAQIAGLGYATTSSVSQSVQSLNSATSSYITSAQTASMTVLSASFAETASFLLGSVASASYALFAETSSFALTSSITQQVSTSISTQNLQHNVLFIDTTGPGLVQVDGGLRYNPNTNLLTTTASLSITASYALNANVDSASLVTTSSFNSYTSSEASNVSASINSATSSLSSSLSSSIGALSASLAATDASQLFTSSFNAFTASVITTGSSAGTQNITGSLVVSGNILVVDQFPTINTNNTFLTSTGSTQLDLSIVRTGGGTADVTNLRLQAISGSNTTGDTVQSQLLVGNNNNTATFFSSSASINLSTTFATGSGGGRVAYSANVSVNAFSGSSNVTITAPTIRMGQAGAQIAITGSNPNILSGSLSGSLISNLGDIYTGSNNANFIITLGSASMASLLAGSATNANTLYFVI
jgi:hypothetical protein